MCGIKSWATINALLSIFAAVLAMPLGYAAEGSHAPAIGGKSDGRLAAQTYCSGCHAFPAPDLLSKSEWLDGALRAMAPFLGVSRLNLDSRPDGALLRQAKVFPEAPLLSRNDWQAIVAFYSNAAPAVVVPPRRIEAATRLFTARPLLRSPDAPCTTLLQWDAKSRSFYIGDAQTRTLRRVDATGTVLRHWETDSGPVALNQFGSNLLVTLVGRILPSDELVGQVWQIDEKENAGEPKRLLRGLRRPVHTLVADVNGDGREEVIVSCFGNRLGNLSMFTPRDPGDYEEHVLVDLPGSVRTIPWDWNGDGQLDLTVLRAQAREGMDLYLNGKDGQFSRHTLWDDVSSNGNAFFDLADFEHDGRPELLVLNGDNGDFECAAKPYHGVRIFSVNRELKAELRFRFAFPGAYGARAADFDLDGDLDIAAVSYFPDYSHAPEQSFVYLRNDGDWKFMPHIIPGLTQGRWIVIDSGDVDEDGDVDLLLGSFSRGPLTIPIPKALRQQWERDRIAVLLLENKTRNKRSAR